MPRYKWPATFLLRTTALNWSYCETVIPITVLTNSRLYTEPNNLAYLVQKVNLLQKKIFHSYYESWLEQTFLLGSQKFWRKFKRSKYLLQICYPIMVHFYQTHWMQNSMQFDFEEFSNFYLKKALLRKFFLRSKILWVN